MSYSNFVTKIRSCKHEICIFASITLWYVREQFAFHLCVLLSLFFAVKLQSFLSRLCVTMMEQNQMNSASEKV
jgi:hypothetical protein